MLEQKVNFTFYKYVLLYFFSDCFFRQEEFNFSLQDYHQALELDPNDETIKSRISVIHNEFGVSAYQDKMYSVSCLTYVYSKTCVKGPLKNRQNKDLNDKW